MKTKKSLLNRDNNRQRERDPTKTSFKKGVSGNPKGRPPKDRCVSNLVQAFGKSKSVKVCYTVYDPDGTTSKEQFKLNSDSSLLHALVARLYSEALSGNMIAAKEIIDRIDGKAPQSMDLTSDDKPIENTPIIQVVDSDAAKAVRRMFSGSA